MLRKKNYHSKTETISKLAVYSQFLQIIFPLQKFELRTGVSELKANYIAYCVPEPINSKRFCIDM